MKSIYKWKIQEVSGVTTFAYIMSEGSNKPFLYNASTKERKYSGKTKEVKEVDDATISNYVNSAEETKYKSSFNEMRNLMAAEGQYISGLKDYSVYFNYENSACYDEGNADLCPEIEISITKTLEPGTPAYTKQIGYYEREGVKVFQYEMGIPEGLRGIEGAQGMQGAQGNRGLQGKTGEQGTQGSTGNSGKDGVSPDGRYVSTIFKKSNTLTPSVEKNTLDNAQPVIPGGENPYYNEPMTGLLEIGWHDSVPTGDSSGNKDAILWMSTKTFTTGDDWGDFKWSEPVKASDSKYVDYEWNANTGWTLEDANANPPQRTNPDDTKPGCSPFNPDKNGWYDEAIPNAIFMAVRKIKDGVYDGGWEISKIKGEDGDKGESLHLKEEWDGDRFYHKDYNKSGDKGEPNEAHTCKSDNTFTPAGSCFISGHIYVWDGDSWEDGGMFNGKSSFLHIKYANEVKTGSSEQYISYLGKFIEWTGEGGETPNGEYTGLYTDENEDDPMNYQLYKWTYSKGKDGFGYEYVYCATSTPTEILVPTGGTKYAIGTGTTKTENWTTSSDSYQKNYDFIPKNVWVKNGRDISAMTGICVNWRDDLITPNASYPYVYEIYRKKEQNGSWGGFIGDKDGLASLSKTYTVSPDFKSTVFKRSNVWYNNDAAVSAEWKRLLAETGSTYDKPVPEGWSDGIPSGKELVWITYRTFTKEASKITPGSEGDMYRWCKPILSEDSDVMDYEWCRTEWEDVYTHPPLRTSPDDNNPGCDPYNPDGNEWYDMPIDGAIWMAQCNVKGGVYEQKGGGYDPLGKEPNWKFSRIKGEKGEDGTNIYLFDLTNEGDTVGLGDDYKLDTTVTNRVTKAFFRCGVVGVKLSVDEIEIDGDLDDITYEKSEESDIVRITFTYHAGLTFIPGVPKNITITFNSEKYGIYTKTFKLSGIKEGKDGSVYELLPSLHVIPFGPNGEKEFDRVFCRAKFGNDDLYGTAGISVCYSLGTTLYETYNELLSHKIDCTGDTQNKYWYIPKEKLNYNFDDITQNTFYFYLLSGTTIVDHEGISFTKPGEQGPQGDTGDQGPQGDPGTPGSAVACVYRGEYDSGKLYYGTSKRTDIVKYNGEYYIAFQNVGEFSNKTPGEGSSYWDTFGTQYENIATGFLFAERAVIENATIRKLSTQDTGKRIEIGGASGDTSVENTIKMFDSYNNRRLLVTGDDLITYPESTAYIISGAGVPYAGSLKTSDFMSGLIKTCEYKWEFIDIEVKDGARIILPASALEFSGNVEVTSGICVSILKECRIYLYNDKTKKEIFRKGISSEKVVLNFTPGSPSKTERIDDYILGIASETNVDLVAGIYHLSVEMDFQFEGGGTVSTSSVNYVQGKIYEGSSNIGSLYYPITCVEIGANGFRAMFTSENTFEAVSGSTGIEFTISTKENGIKVTQSDLLLKFEKIWYKAEKYGDSIKLTAIS